MESAIGRGFERAARLSGPVVSGEVRRDSQGSLPKIRAKAYHNDNTTEL
jgi:hypothetical protein